MFKLPPPDRRVYRKRPVRIVDTNQTIKPDQQKTRITLPWVSIQHRTERLKRLLGER